MIGWIHTHPSQNCLPSAVDIHMHYRIQKDNQNAIMIILSPRYNLLEIYNLTASGMLHIMECKQLDHHIHDENNLFIASEHANLCEDSQPVEFINASSLDEKEIPTSTVYVTCR